MTRLYEPVVLGKGVTIESKPSDPKHAVRVEDLKEYAKMQRVEFENEVTFTVPRLAKNSVVQVYDTDGNLVTPNKQRQPPDEEIIEFEFLEPQSGYLLIFSVGEL